MKKLMLGLVAAAAGAAIAAAPAAASHSWNGYHWARTSNPFTLKVGNNVSTAWLTTFQTSNHDWSQSTVLDLLEVAGSGNKRCSMTSGTVQVCNGKYGNNGWLGLASINITGGTHITQGSAKMNDTYFQTATYNNPNERQHVMCQEVGHTFGLGHQSETGESLNTCMDYFSNTGVNATSTLSTRPDGHDYDELTTIYGHLDASSTLAAATASSGMAGRSDTRPYRTARQDGRRRSELREYFADGTARITEVLWADGPRTVIDRG